MSDTADVEDILDLSAIQQGLLLESLSAGTRDPYLVQMTCRLHGPLELPALRTAWQSAIDRHAVLRCSFHWEGLPRPVQVVHRAVTIPFVTVDLDDRPADEAWAEILADDQRRGFPPRTAPLTRVTVLREGPDTHRLLWTHHHLLLDGWSVALVLEEVLGTYAAIAAGRPVTARPVPAFSSYLLWLRGQDTAASEAYWAARLRGFTSPVVLASDKGTTPGKNRWDVSQGELSSTGHGAVLERLEQWCRRHGTTPACVHHLAWALVLRAHSARRDVVFGSTVSCRPEDVAGARAMVGPLINSIPVRVATNAGRTLRACLDDIADQLVPAGARHHLDLNHVRRLSELPNDTPLFDSIVAIENYPADRQVENKLDEVRITDVAWRGGTGAPLSLIIVPDEGTVTIRHHRERFDDETIRRLLDYFVLYLTAIVDADPSEPLGTLPALVPGDHTTLLDELTDSQPLASGEPVHERVTEWARTTPDAPALVDDRTALTYRELDQRATALAHGLRTLGVATGSRVALRLEPSVDLVVAVIAVLKAGGTYVPLNAADPPERRREIVTAARPLLVLVDNERSPLGTGIPEVSARTAYAAANEHTRLPATRPSHSAYVIFTSGSTGKPKGVVVSHQALSNYLSWAAETYTLGPGSISPLHSSLAVDLTVTTMLGPLFSGGTVRILRHDTSGEALAEYLSSRRQPGTVKLTPTHLAAFRDREPNGLSGSVVIGGEALRADMIAGWLRANPAARFFNEYGPTEATVACVTHRIDRLDPESADVPIGRPVAGARCHVLDADLRMVPPGVPGELVLAGPGLADGYLDRPSATASAFVPDPIGALPGERVYRTGDIVRHGPHGLTYLGRKDGQVKIRGHRVEPAEIEAKLSTMDAVAAAVVIPDDSGIALSAYVVPAAGHALREPDLVAFLEERLPRHLVPTRYAIVDELPLSSSGKLDRGRLRREARLPVDPALFRPPSTPVEQTLAALWATVLEVPTVGVDNDFFRLGGDSLRAMGIVGRLPARLRGRFTVGDLLADRTIAALARRIARTSDTPSVARQPVPPPQAVPAAQRRFFALHNLDPTRCRYNTASAVLLRGPLDQAHLQAAVDLVIARHDVLRTSFTLADGHVVAAVAPSAKATVDHTDLSGLPDTDRRDEARRLARLAATTPFDLAVAPLFRVRVFTIGGDEHVLLLVLHHIVSDGRSQAVIVAEIGASYETLTRQRDPELPPAPQYAAVAARLEAGEAMSETVERFWRAQLDPPLPNLLLPDRSRPGGESAAESAEVKLSLDRESWTAITTASRDEGVSVFSTLIAALRLVLSRFYRAEGEVAIGVPVSLRDTDESAGTIGPLLNTVVVRGAVDAAHSLAQLLRAEQARVAEALAHKDIPFEKLVRELAPRADGDGNPFFDVLLDFQRIDLTTRGGFGAVEEFDIGAPAARLDLEVDVWELDGHASVRFVYRADLFTAATIESLAEAYRVVLRELARDRRTSARDVPLLDFARRRRLEESFNDTAVDFRGSPFVHERIAAQAAATPDVIAVELGTDQLTYRELDRTAERWARHLATLSVAPETPVGLIVDRSIDLLVAVVAILKAGGVYLPLDPSYPDERLRDMVADARPAVIITDERHADRLADSGPPVLRIADLAAASEDPATTVRPALAPDNAAYILFTSGSTGRPKGVVTSHAALVNRLRWAQAHFGLDETDRVLHKTPVGFDVSVWELLWPFMTGARTVVAKPGGHRDPEYLTQLIRDRGVTTVHFVPSLLRATVDTGLLTGCGSLRRIICSGEALTPSLCGDVRRIVPDAVVHNLYGPTEAAIDVTYWQAGDEPVPDRVPIGRPVANTAIHVVDELLTTQPMNAPGELCIGGVQVARGYLARPGLTADRFRPDPFSGVPGSRLYRTGDLARVRDDGSIDFLGRADTQVKIRGQRIELEEIESVLARHPAVRECVVDVVAGNDGPRLAAFYVPDAPATTKELGDHLRRFLPPVMIPAVWTTMGSLPRTASGKIARRSLPRHAEAKTISATFVEPRPGREETLAQAWRTVLGVRQVGRGDSFFALGGDSIRAIHLTEAAREAGLSLTIPDVFAAPELSAMAERASSADGDDDDHLDAFSLLDEADRTRVPDGATDAYPMTALQAGMVFHAQHTPGTTLYKNLDIVELRSTVDRERLLAAIQLLIDRHAVLRTSFVLDVEHTPLQVVHGKVAAVLDVADLRGIDREAQERELAAWTERQLHRDWDFTTPPLIQFHVHILDDDRFRLAIPHHHAILDGWSLSSLAAELVEAYLALRDEREVTLPPVDDSAFRRYVHAELRATASPESTAFWAGLLAGRSPGRLSPWQTTPPRENAPARQVAAVAFDDKQTSELRSWAAEHGIPLKSALFTIHCAVLAVATGRSDVLTGMVIHGRPAEAGGASVLGLFLNSLPMPVSTGDGDWPELAHQVFDLERAVMKHRHVPMERLRRTREVPALFDTVFNFTNFHVLNGTARDDYTVIRQESYTTSSIPLAANFDLDPAGRRLRVELTAIEPALPPDQLDALAALYRTGVERLLADAPGLGQVSFEPGVEAAEPTPASQTSSLPYLHPQTPVQELIQRLCADLLEIDAPSMAEDFFELGGHSLLAMRLKARIRNRLGVEVPLSTIFDFPRLAEIAKAVESASDHDQRVIEDPVRTPDGNRALASATQLNLWQITAALPKLPLFNMPMAIHIAGELDPDAFLTAMRLVVDRHPALRTHLEATPEGEVMLAVGETGAFEPKLVDLSGLPEEEAARRRAARERAIVLWPFDLAHGPLVHAELVRLADGWVFLLAMHHAIADGWSVGIVMRDLGIAYQAVRAGVATPWAGPPAVGFADFVRWQHERIRDGSFAHQVDYWRKILARPLKPVITTLDRPRVKAVSLQAGKVDVEIPPEVVAGLEPLRSTEHVSLFMILATVFADFLRQDTGSDDIRLGTLNANRGRGAVTDTVGLFMNTLLLRFDLTDATTFADRLRRVRTATFGAFANQDIPFEALSDELDLSSHDRRELFRHMLVLQTAPLRLPDVDGLVMREVKPKIKGPEPTMTTQDLVLNLAPKDGGLAGHLTYRPDLFDHGTVERIARTFVDSLAALAE